MNVQRLKEYLAKIIVFPRKGKLPATEQVLSTAAAFPIVQPATDVETRAVENTDVSAYVTLRMARSDKKFRGIREKRAKEKAEAEAEKKK